MDGIDRPTMIEMRKRQGLTQKELARRAGLHPQTIRRIERGSLDRPSAHTVALIARGLGCGVEMLVPTPS